MADISKMVGYVQSWTRDTEQHPEWGMRVDEGHGKKGETKTYTNYTVKVSRDSGINLTQFRKGDRVAVVGNLVTEVSEKTDANGRPYKNLVIWASSVSVDEYKGDNAPTQRAASPVIPDDDTPF